MRKSIIDHSAQRVSPFEQNWLEIEELAKIEVTSEDPNFPVESALSSKMGQGWRAAERGSQIIRIIFDEPRALQRIRLEFCETEVERTQEFILRWSAAPAGLFKEIVRQQWNFSPRGSTSEVEDYQVKLSGVSVLELALRPDLTPDNALATLASWRMA
jgi:uncharacterized protein (DUF736 family)